MLWKRKVMFNLKTNIAYSIRGILYTRNMMPVLKIKKALWLVHETRKDQLWQGVPLAVIPPGAHPCKWADSGWIGFQSMSLICFPCYSFLELIHAGGFGGWGIWLVWTHLCVCTWRYFGTCRRTGWGTALQRVTQVSGWPYSNVLPVFSCWLQELKRISGSLIPLIMSYPANNID